MSKDSWKAGINENTGIIFSDKTTEAQRNAAQKANQRIFEEFGDEARKYYNSNKITKGGDNNDSEMVLVPIKELATYCL